MKKLSKRIYSTVDTIEAFACSCYCPCYCSCYCGNASRTYSNDSSNDNRAESTDTYSRSNGTGY